MGDVIRILIENRAEEEVASPTAKNAKGTKKRGKTGARRNHGCPAAAQIFLVLLVSFAVNSALGSCGSSESAGTDGNPC